LRIEYKVPLFDFTVFIIACKNGDESETLDGLFDDLQKVIETTMLDAYHRFQKSTYFEEMKKQLKIRTLKRHNSN